MKRFKFIFAWYDLYFGIYVDCQRRRIYVFPLPMLGFYIQYGKDETLISQGMEIMRFIRGLQEIIRGMRVPLLFLLKDELSFYRGYNKCLEDVSARLGKAILPEDTENEKA